MKNRSSVICSTVLKRVSGTPALHTGLPGRIFSTKDMKQNRKWGGQLNGVAILAFFITTALMIFRNKSK